MAEGYTLHMLELNEQADPENIGVRLGRLCIKHKVPVSEIALRMGVTRAAVYKWFRGAAEPQQAARVKIEEYIATLE